jgi:ubiquinone/menaquinone biosynthesis C-methylase UbiE
MTESLFEIYAQKYDSWYEKHLAVYESELEAMKELIPPEMPEKSLEIGVGTGRFASALGISYGLDPSRKMLEIAEKHGVGVIKGIAEDLPLKSSSFELILMVTSICFVDVERTLLEISRVLVSGGKLIIAFIERNSPLGKEYQKKAQESHFYGNATFHSAKELINRLEEYGFYEPVIRQTIFKPLSEIKVMQIPEEGFSRGSFVVVGTRSIKNK